MSETPRSLDEASKRRIERLVNLFCRKTANGVVDLFDALGKPGFPEIQVYIAVSLIAFLEDQILPRLKLLAPNPLSDEELEEAINQLLNLKKEDAN